MPLHIIPIFISLVVIGGALAQWPTGRLSDRIDRRTVLAVLCLSAAVLAMVLFNLDAVVVAPKLIVATLFGFSALPVYWVSFAHANDLAEPGEAVDISSSLLLLFAVAAIGGPMIAALMMRLIGTQALFLHTAVVHVLIAGFVIYRMTRRAPLPPRLRIAYDSLPKSTTPAGLEKAIAGEAASRQG